jgi:hypothetical protein
MWTGADQLIERAEGLAACQLGNARYPFGMAFIRMVSSTFVFSASAVLLALSPLPAFAEPPHLSLIFGADTLAAQSDDIQSVRRVDEGASGSGLVVRLAPGFNRLMLALTTAHVGETGRLVICGETVLEPQIYSPIAEAVFVITDTDPARIDRLQALLAGTSCSPAPES